MLILLNLWSCASSKKYAIQLSQKGLHEAAIPKWIEALKENPEDIEAQVGFKISQETVVNDRLVRIRDLRSAKDYPAALIELRALVETQNNWGIKLDFNTSSFQGNEAKYLWVYQKVNISNLIKAEKPLAAESENRRFSSIFSSMSDFTETKENISKAGFKKCQMLHKNLEQKPFYGSFVGQFCRFFNPGRNISNLPTSLPSVLFSSTKVVVEIKGIDDDMSAAITNFFNKEFSDTPWFHSESKKLINIKVTGKYVWIPKSQSIHQAHDYTVSIPYTAYVPVMKTRQEPYQANEYRCVYNAYAGNICGNVSVTRYKTDYYWENEPVTKYREEARVHNYIASKKSQDLILLLKGNYVIDGQVTPFSFSKHETEEKIVHDMNLPEIGLYPTTSDVSSPVEKFKNYSELASIDLKRDMNSLWIKKFCVLPKDRNIASIAENVVRCRRIKDHPADFVDKWFNNNYGISSTEAENIIGAF